MKHYVLGLLAALILASGGGCKKPASEVAKPQSTPKPPPSATLAQVHWLGKSRIAAQTNSTGFMSLWNLPESAALERQTLDKLALAIAGESQRTNPIVLPVSTNPPALITNYVNPGTNYAALVAGNPAAARLRPLLDDLVREEWYLEVQQPSRQPGELALAVRLDDPHAALWTSNLAAVLGSMSSVQSLPAPTNGRAWRLPIAPRPARLDLARAGGWTLLGLSEERNTRLDDFAARIQRGQTPVAPSEDASSLQMDPVTRTLHPAPASPETAYWLEASLDLRRISSALALGWNLPDSLPSVSLTAEADKQGVRTRADLLFSEPMPLEMEAWNIPTNIIRDPLIGFSAVRGIRQWLKSSKPWQDLHLGTPPNQAYFWAQSGLPGAHFVAAPSAEARNQVNKLTDLVLRDLNPILATNGWPLSDFARQLNAPGLVWQGIPYFSPNLDYADSRGNPFLVAGLAHIVVTNPSAPARLFQYLEESPRLVAYDWENTRICLDGWTQMGQLTRHMLCLPRMTFTAGLAWVVALSPKLDISVTGVEVTSPMRLSLVRTSSVGFTAAELHLLADWLESLQFPRGLHTFTAPPPPPPPTEPPPDSPATNAPAPRH